MFDGPSPKFHFPADAITPALTSGGDIAILLDVDDCLVPVNQHRLTEEQKEILWDLHRLTGGAVALLTNNTMTSIDQMIPGFPCVTEFGMFWRLKAGDPIENCLSKAPPLDMGETKACVEDIADKHGITIVDQQNNNYVYPQYKMGSIAFNFGSNQELKKTAELLAKQLKQDMKLQSHSVHVGIDSVEIIPTGRKKADAVHAIMEREEFKGKRLFMAGDSGTDHEVQTIARTNYNGGGIAVGSAIKDSCPVFGRVKSPEKLWDVLRGVRDRLKVNDRTALPKRTSSTPKVPAPVTP